MARRLSAVKTSGSADDERLLIEAAQREPSRFAELYESHFNRVYAFIARRVRVREVAEDLTADVFHRALANLRQFEWRGVPFSAWLLRIASNAIADHANRAAREHNLSDPDQPEQVSLEEIQHRARLFRSVETLPTEQRRVITMRFAEQRSIREIAQAIRRTEGAVKQLQFRALQTLRTRLGKADA